ncbi:hypothetical protein PTUN_a0411 [Pseudoalteromonas tunicata]|uniref:Uncharacterized protein n=1 Tax=Pseudoalteromonas tunicata D2 TaxID=87626 RepID=A4C7Y7_9GAMM|nr:hypothetical protein PTUN_a0411 [Pseudoalteromonas tunicata]EAR28702.1 hypothetical protein PTD2_06659 [Pseudoalteromonas tunicata D2]
MQLTALASLHYAAVERKKIAYSASAKKAFPVVKKSLNT